MSTRISVAAAPRLALVTAAGRPPRRTTSPPLLALPLPDPLDPLRHDRDPERSTTLKTLSEQRHDFGSVSLAHRRGTSSRLLVLHVMIS